MRLPIQIGIIYFMFYIVSSKCGHVKTAAELLEKSSYDEGNKVGSIQENTEYSVQTDFVNWFQALINCRSMGMDLASIQTEEDQERLGAYLRKNGYNKGYWLGATNLGNGQYYWIPTGKPVVYTNWIQPNEPNNYNGIENCIQWGRGNSSHNPNGWNDKPCEAALPYICQN